MARIFHTHKDRLGRNFSIGPWWCNFTWCPYGWSFYTFRRRIAWKPINYSKIKGG